MNQPTDIEYRRARVGYFVHEPHAACRACGACERKGKYYWCRRNDMWVNSRAICTDFCRDPYNAEPTQCDFGELFNVPH